MMFSDIVKPIFEKNMDIKFIRNNADVMYTLKKLMEENEVSRQANMTDLTRYSLYNMSRMIFIPSSQLIMYRNGESGMGDSVFEKALTPAQFCILTREGYISWILVDGKGMTFIEIPKGLSEISNETGTNDFMEQFRATQVTRQGIREIGNYDYPISQKMIIWPRDPNAAGGGITTEQITPPDFTIDQDMMNRFEQEAEV